MILTSKTSGYTLHPEGIFPAICVDLIDLGLETSTFQGETKTANKLRLTFETTAMAEGKPCTISKKFTASLHPKAKLTEFLGKWRGRPVLPNEEVDLGKLIGANCTLVISHADNLSGKKFANIDAVSKPTQKLTISGHYSPAEARQRIEEWKAKESGGLAPATPIPQAAPAKGVAAPKAAPSKSTAAPAASALDTPIDPEVGF